MSEKAPLVKEIEAQVPAQGTAGTAQDTVIDEVPFDGTITAVTVIPEANVTANATNYRTIRVLNSGAAGSGSTVVASRALDTPTTDDLVKNDEKSIPLSGTAANLEVAAGDVLVADETVAASGLAHGGYVIKVEISRD
jgi:hypothetical protein